MNASPRKSTQVTPATGHAMKMNAIGSSASSEVWSQPKRTNWMPHHTKTNANTRTKRLVTICRNALGHGGRSGNTSTTKCEPSRTPIIAPSMIIQMKRKRESSSVQIHEGISAV